MKKQKIETKPFFKYRAEFYRDGKALFEEGVINEPVSKIEATDLLRKHLGVRNFISIKITKQYES